MRKMRLDTVIVVLVAIGALTFIFLIEVALYSGAYGYAAWWTAGLIAGALLLYEAIYL